MQRVSRFFLFLLAGLVLTGLVVAPVAQAATLYPYTDSSTQKYGLVNGTGQVVLTPQYDVIYPNGAGLYVMKQDGLTGLLDATGKVLVPAEWQRIDRFFDGYALAKKNDAFGFLDGKGKTVIAPQYEAVGVTFADGLAEVVKDGKHLYIDKTARVIFEWP